MSLSQLLLAILVCTSYGLLLCRHVYSWKILSRYEADHVYALNTVYFMCAVIGVFAISNILVRLTPDRVRRTRPWRMFTSGSRYLSYHGYRLPVLQYWSPALGVVILGAVGAVFFLGGCNGLAKLEVSSLILDYSNDTGPSALLLADRCFIWK